MIASKLQRLWIGVAGLALAGTACAPTRVAEHFGESQRGNVARMVQNPEAEYAPAAAVEGLDPLTGEAVVGNYEREQGESREASQLPSIIEFTTGSGR